MVLNMVGIPSFLNLFRSSAFDRYFIFIIYLHIIMSNMKVNSFYEMFLSLIMKSIRFTSVIFIKPDSPLMQSFSIVTYFLGLVIPSNMYSEFLINIFM